MPNPLRSLTSPQSYWRTSKTHRYSLLFALPLLALYETLAALLSHDPRGEVRNGADVLLRDAFYAVAGPRGGLLFGVCLIGGSIWLVARDVHRSGPPNRGSVFAGMAAEAATLAFGFGFVVSAVTARLLGLLAVGAGEGVAAMPWSTRLMVSLGAGLYEELLFRVILVAAIGQLCRRVFGFGPWSAGAIAVLVGAAIFSAFHYVGPYGDPFELRSFVFRMIAGIFFSALYLLRGFGITAWTHALYDVYLLQ
ncbi:MAG: CPBP family intramembrane glutamic endopeptidase [Gemmatimonadaceae bacterium]